MTSETHQCAHINCQCRVPDGEKYCGEYCLEARDITETGCGCEHPPCIDQP